MQALEWAMMYPELVARVIPIGCGLSHSAWAIGLNEAARRAIIDDADWNGGEYTVQPARGLGLARMIAMISYRSPRSFQDKFGRALRPGVLPPLFEIESYLRHQAEKLVNRFDANTYLYITRAMDSHDVSRGRGQAYDAVRKNPVHCLAIGIHSDTLYPTNEQREIASTFPHGEYAEIDSPHGHDAFLIEYDQLNTTVRGFLQRTSIQDSP
jgi:homoserine O-acetyltransferase